MAISKLMSGFLQNSLGVPSNFFVNLARDDDWSFIIKLNAVIEAAFIHLLVSHFADERLREVILALDNGDKSRGRLAFVSALDLIPSECRDFVVQLGRIRNPLAHGIRHVEFNIKKDMDKERRKNLKKAILGMFDSLDVEIKLKTGEKRKVNAKDIIDENLRTMMQWAVLGVLAHVLNRDLERNGNTSREDWTHSFDCAASKEM